jgi:hypothetical protein
MTPEHHVTRPWEIGARTRSWNRAEGTPSRGKLARQGGELSWSTSAGSGCELERCGMGEGGDKATSGENGGGIFTGGERRPKKYHAVRYGGWGEDENDGDTGKSCAG